MTKGKTAQVGFLSFFRASDKLNMKADVLLSHSNQSMKLQKNNSNQLNRSNEKEFSGAAWVLQPKITNKYQKNERSGMWALLLPTQQGYDVMSQKLRPHSHIHTSWNLCERGKADRRSFTLVGSDETAGKHPAKSLNHTTHAHTHTQKSSQELFWTPKLPLFFNFIGRIPYLVGGEPMPV